MSINVLLVEETPAVCRELTRLLMSHRDIAVVGSAADLGIAMRGPGSPRVDVVVVDLNMPLLCVTSAVRHLRQNLPSVKVIMISFQADPHYVKEHLDAGVSGYVLKDRAYEELMEAVQIVATGGRYISSQIEIGVT